jgi:multimeric flavodoxin WrbA
LEFRLQAVAKKEIPSSCRLKPEFQRFSTVFQDTFSKNSPVHTPKRILGIVGSYRKGSTVDSTVSEILAAAAECGAETSKIRLIDAHVEFCTNCRACTQEPGPQPGPCVLEDEMRGILDEIRRSDGLVLGSPVNFGDVTAITKRFQERLVCYAYWPWDPPGAPALRNKALTKKAVLVTSSAAPTLAGRLLFKAPGTLKRMAKLLGARPIGTLYIGSVMGQQPKLPEAAINKARALGSKLAS